MKLDKPINQEQGCCPYPNKQNIYISIWVVVSKGNLMVSVPDLYVCSMLFQFKFMQKWIWNWNKNLRSENGSFTFKEEGKVAGKNETSGEPPAGRNIELSTTLISKGLKIENGIVKGNCVGSFAISHCTKLQDGHSMRSWFWRILVFTLSIIPDPIMFNSITQCYEQKQCHLKKKEGTKGKGKRALQNKKTVPRTVPGFLNLPTVIKSKKHK